MPKGEMHTTEEEGNSSAVEPQPTGHEQGPIVIVSLLLLIASVVWYGVIYRLDESNTVPFGPWPQGPNSAQPPQELIDAAAEEMREEIPRFLPLALVLFGLFALVAGLVLAVSVV